MTDACLTSTESGLQIDYIFYDAVIAGLTRNPVYHLNKSSIPLGVLEILSESD